MNPSPTDALFAAAYEELRRLASVLQGRGDSPTLNPTALVHEAWLRLRRSVPAWESEAHFKRIAARAMRQILVEAARRRLTAKRGGVQPEPVYLDHDAFEPGTQPVELESVLAVDGALHELEALDARQAQIVEGYFFAGLEWKDLAGELGVSEATVFRDWRMARAWLAARLRTGNADG